MKTQGLRITIKELTELKLELIKEIQEEQKQLGIKDWEYVDYDQGIIVGIVNKEKTPDGEYCCDTWRLQK